MGGVLGSLLLGLFGKKAVNSIGADGLFYGGGLTLLGWQVVALASVIAFSFVVTWLIAMVIEKTIGLRVSTEDESALDTRQQGMDAYHFSQVLGFGHEGAAEAPEPAASITASGSSATGAESLVTALIDPEATDMVGLRQALLAAGARTIIVSEAHVLTADPTEVTIRNAVRSTNVVPLLRVEVLVPGDRLDEARSALDAHTSGDVRARFATNIASPG